MFRWLLKIRGFGRPHCCSGEFVELRIRFSRLEMIEDRILYSALRRTVGLQSLTEMGLEILGINSIRATLWDEESCFCIKVLLKDWVNRGIIKGREL